jgi:hypothetical protein
VSAAVAHNLFHNKRHDKADADGCFLRGVAGRTVDLKRLLFVIGDIGI